MRPSINLSLDSKDLALGYERDSADRQFKSGQTLIEALGIDPGDHVLDIGAGTGLLTAYVADLVGPSGSVIGIDPLQLRIEIANRRARANLRFAVGNAQDLTQFEPASFDVVYLNSVFHWLPDQPAALQQINGVMKSGGRLGISTGSGDHPYVLQLIKARVMSREPFSHLKETASGAPQNPRRRELEALLERAGFDIRTIKLNPSVNITSDPDAMIDFFEASAFGNFLGNLPGPLRDMARKEVVQELEALRTDEGIRMELMRLIAVAVKP